MKTCVRRRPVRSLLLPLIVCAVAAPTFLLGAQDQPPASDDPPVVFRSGIDAVQLDVTVVDRDGRPVTDLRVDDFDVLENGEPRAIATFAEVRVPAVPRERAYGGVEPDVATNMLPEGRVYVFALDEVSPESTMRARQFLRDFIERHFGANDLGAVVLVGRGLAATGQDFTHSRARLLAAIDRYSPFPDRSTSDRVNQIAALRALTESLATIPGRRKAVLVVSEGIGVDMFDVVDYRGRATTLDAFCLLTSTPPHSCRSSRDAHAMLVAAHHGNVAFYPVDPRGLTPDLLPYRLL